MLPQSHFIAFNDIKSKRFSTTLRDTSIYVISCIYVNQLLKYWTKSTSYIRASFVDLLRKPESYRKVASRLRLNRSKAEAWNYTKNKLLKVVNSVKADFLLSGLNLKKFIQNNVKKCTFRG